jgi:hypothetical protein
MANAGHLTQLQEGVEAWNQWRAAHPDIRPNLREVRLIQMGCGGIDFSRTNLTDADLTLSNLSGANLTKANLTRAVLSGSDLSSADLSQAILADATLDFAHFTQADLSGADLRKADLENADLSGADLTNVNLSQADLFGAVFTGANLSGANLVAARLLDTSFERANLTGCRVYRVSVWNVNLVGAQQSNLIITSYNEPIITVDNLDVAQFIYLLLNNEKIREVIDTITSKAVLILGRFNPPERKAVLDAIREELRRRNYLPIVFDFEVPGSRDLTETISTLAHMARFIIADLTEAKSIPQELQRIVPDLPSVPVQPVLQASAEEYSMFEHFKRYPWVLETYRYQSLDEVITALPEKVIAPAELKAKELIGPMRR